MTSRRLSRGSAIIQEVPGNDDEAERERLRAQREKRRLSHTPTARRRLSGAVGRVEPDREVLEIYDRCIKLSAENKINRQNTWDLSLIDHIDDVIGDTGANTNFQKASCTLDASVKIYSYRVDSVHHDMFQVLGGLSRSEEDENQQEGHSEGFEDGDESAKESSALGSRPRQRNKQQQLNCHLELKPSALCVPLSELLFEVDPMFQRTASSFDEGGAKGLLLNQLYVGQRCHIVFDFSSDMNILAADEHSESIPIEIPSAFLSMWSNIYNPDIHISPLTSRLRVALNENVDSPHADDVVSETAHNTFTEGSQMDERDDFADNYDCFEDDGDESVDNGGHPFIADSNETDFFDNHELRPTDDGRNESDGFQEKCVSELNSDIDPNIRNQLASNDVGIFSPANSRRATALFSEANGLNLPYLQLNKNWAGPGVGVSHWRFKGESQQTGQNQESELETLNTRLKKARVTCDINFRGPPVPDVDLADPTRASNTLSMASYTKAASLNHLLPTDLHISQTVLFRLFHRPSFFLRPGSCNRAEATIHGNGLSRAPGDDVGHSFSVFEDRFDDDDDGFTPNLCDDDRPNCGLFSSEFNFIAQPATAEKIEIDFAKSVKKVDIKAVKQCLWSRLSDKTENAPPLSIDDTPIFTAPDVEPYEVQPFSQSEWPSFKEIIDSVPVPDSSKDAMSVQLFFICLLHLANENDLVLKPKAIALGDFSIGRRAQSEDL